MNSNHNEWKVWALFTLAAIAAIFTATLSRATSAKTQEILEPTIENRIAKIRERIKQNEEKISHKSGTHPSLQNSLKTKKDKAIIAQSQWPNYWNDWSNWGNRPWGDWSNRPWGNWGNY